MELTDALRANIRAQLTAKPQAKKRENRQVRTSSGLWSRPFASDALGVSPDQIEEAREHLRKSGVMADFDEQGRCIVTSDKQFRDVAKACGIFTGRDGYQQTAEDGNRIFTGREQAEGRRAFREALERDCR